MTAPHIELAASDIARALDVQRPLISMWRSRYAGSPHPFPEGDRVTSHDLQAWLAHTDRLPDRVGPVLALHGELVVRGLNAQIVDDGVEALLVLARLSGEALGSLGAAGVHSLADDIDPDDRSLTSEILALGGSAGAVANLVATMLDAVPDAGAALEVRRRRSHPSPELATAAAETVTRLALALAEWEPGAAARFHDSFPAEGALPAAMPAAAGGWDLPELSTPPLGEGRAARRLRRRLLAHGWLLRELPEGDPEPGELTVSDLTGVADPEEALTAAERIALSLPEGSRAVVLGRASALVARLDGAADSVRADLLRSGRVRAIARTPAGWVPGRSREISAIWVLGDPMDGMPLAKRRTTLVDLGPLAAPGGTLPYGVVNDLVTDVLAAVEGLESMARHAFARSRVVLTSRLLAKGGDLLAGLPDRSVSRAGANRDRVAEVGELVRATHREGQEALPLRVEAHDGAAAREVSVADLVARGALRAFPGNRRPERLGLVEGGGIGLVSAADVAAGVLDQSESLRTTAAELGQRMPAARLTEPGDVIIATAPRPAAVLDVAGGHVVLAPARVLRPVPGKGVAGGAVVHAVHAAGAQDKRWRAWQIPVLAPDQAQELHEASLAIERRRIEAREELLRMNAVAAGLVAGMSVGTMRISSTTDEGMAGGQAR
ncbi:hypothetical protein [Serinibacter salmoneus]|uniref:Uncharacterized protein n=1 Tax=Serinibacter salmoneus TaxID=556530 RepID=A0A2A9D1S4_9MICO|nr:hypothetical protein [Serinibacter salmoneus]PFG20668.1 hypothetical protein ATL40_2276 [Serinibacter salmoneus]